MSFRPNYQTSLAKLLAAILIGCCGVELLRKAFVISLFVMPGDLSSKLRICSGSVAITFFSFQ
jgi:hypothetical protein